MTFAQMFTVLWAICLTGEKDIGSSGKLLILMIMYFVMEFISRAWS